jgi:ferredoxin
VVTAPAARWRLHVDPDTCIGSGICAGIDPEHFTLVGGVSVATPGPVAPDDAAVDAAVSSPVEAITVRDAGDDHLIAPEP